MNDNELYARILGLETPWRVTKVDLALKKGEVLVVVEMDPSGARLCAECGAASPGYDTLVRRWRHLDTCQYRTILEAQVPRTNCATHGVKQVRTPWAEAGSRFTALFEAMVIAWLKQASAAGVAKEMHLSWDEVDGIQGRAVKRGLERRHVRYPKRLGVDETSFQKRHEYVTVISDQKRSEVLDVQDDRKTESLDRFFGTLTNAQRKRIELVAMDMWPPFMNSVAKNLEDGASKIAFDKFHVAKMLGDAVDKTRREENRELLAEGDRSLVGKKYLFLSRTEPIDPDQDPFEFRQFTAGMLRTARAWAIKETAMHLWSFDTVRAAKAAWNRWLAWASRSRLPSMVHVARTVRKHLQGILVAVIHKITNADGESINAKIQRLKQRACGYRNRQRFRNAILFHFGGLDLMPRTLASTHTKV